MPGYRSSGRHWQRILTVPAGPIILIENVAIQPGGKPVISKFLLSVMNAGDEVLYPNPGFPIYESQIEFHGGIAVPYGTIPGDGNFTFDIEGLEASING